MFSPQMFSKRFALLKSYLMKRTVVPVYPSVIGLETTSNCNLDCIMCPRQNMERPAIDMEMDVFQKIIDDVEGKVEFVWLQGYGEPFINKNIFKMIRYARSKRLRTGISTNSTIFTDNVVDQILESGLDYMICAVDGVTKQTYESVRKGGSFDFVVTNIQKLLREKIKRRSNLFVVLQTIYMEETELEVEEFRKLWDVKGVNGIRIRQLTYSGGNGKYKNRLDNSPCYWLWSDPHINANGTVIPCCQDVNEKYALGNIKNNSISEIWNSSEMIRLRRMHIEGRYDQIEICRDCNMYQPPIKLLIGSAFFRYFTVNKLIPKIETLISLRRFSKKRNNGTSNDRSEI